MTLLQESTTQAKQRGALLHDAQQYVAKRHDISQSRAHARKWVLPSVERVYQYLAAFESQRVAP